MAGGSDVLRELGAPARAARARWRAFNRSLGVTVHRAYIMAMPMGDFSSVYFEAPDPAAANRGFAADTSDFGTFFKERAAEAVGIDFSEPLPPVRTVMDSGR